MEGRSMMDCLDLKDSKSKEYQDSYTQMNDWKQGLSFLEEYGYNLDQLQPYSRITIQTDTSLTSTGGRSAPTVDSLQYPHL